MNLPIGALLGAIAAPLSIQLSYALLLPRLVPASVTADCGTPFLFRTGHFGFDFASGAVLGVLSALHFRSNHFQFWRFRALLGGCVFAYYAWNLTTTFDHSPSHNSEDAILHAHLLSFMPLLIWAFALLLLDLLFTSRTPRTLPRLVHS